MKNPKITWQIFGMYLLVIIFMLWSGTACSQIQISIFNAEWNKANDIDWVSDLKEVKTISYIDIGSNTELQKKHKIAVVPTIIIFKDNEEVARFQADLSFKMVATREEVQDKIEEIIMEDF